MRRLSLSLDALPALREAGGGGRASDLVAATSLAELAGVDALRLSVCDELRPVSEADVLGLRRSARVFELRMAPTQGLLKLALDARPDAVVLTDDAGSGTLAARPLELRAPPGGLATVRRALEDAGVPLSLLVAPTLEAVKAAHGQGALAVELDTSGLVDLPAREREPSLEAFGDAARLASKLRMSVTVGGGLDYASVVDLLPAVPSADRVSVGRAVLGRALLVGLDRALRDFIERIRLDRLR